LKVNADIKFTTDTAFLTPEDLKIATELKTILLGALKWRTKVGM
jgi:hypothetical protein